MPKNQIETAYILAGGRGIRMRRLGEYVPKCSLPIYDQPLIIRLVEACRKAGVSKTIISISKKYEKLIHAILFPLYSQKDVSVIVDQEQKGPVYALLDSRKHLEGRNFFFLLGDIYLEKDDFYITVNKKPSNTLILDAFLEKDQALICAGCNIQTKGESVIQICEKPKPEQVVGNLCWTGFSVHPADFYSRIDPIIASKGISSFSHVGKLYQAALEQGMKITYVVEEGRVINLTTPDDVLYANLIELHKIYNLRPNEKKKVWSKLGGLFK